ncbi:hypothetical protein B0J11DRAFT_582421 [Dendryphion nanum]|uniref:Uncharacterized protein n=1 Tax=Dendryphion nanum TaxID=256645 RepID=A0A9P9IGM8_9PLEO|nr:hypothetical protein B0J11DRAFT_582421 [Dendryphion nanum]
MKLLDTLSIAAIISLASAAPTPVEAVSNKVTPLVPVALLGPITDSTFATKETGTKRDVEEPKKRIRQVGNPMTFFFIFFDPDMKGLGQRIDVETQVCYNVPARFNDQISSISMAPDSACHFYEHSACRGARLTIPAFTSYLDLRAHGFDDKISSYLCYPA